MSGEGSPAEQFKNGIPNDFGKGIRVAVVYGQWHEKITEGLLAGTRRTLEAAGADYYELPVHGSFELPVVSLHALENDADAVVALGVIIRGGTPHFEYVSDAATSGLLEVSLKMGKPVGFGVLTLDDEQQGIDRAGFPESKEDKGEEATLAALDAVHTIRRIREQTQK